MTDIINPIDQDFEELASDKSGPVYGLVVGCRLSEAEFEAMAVELNAMSKARNMPEIIFCNEADEIETRAPGRGINE